MKSNAEKYPIVTDKIITNPYEGLVFGNGDVAANAVINSHELVLMLGKNDIWDSRLDNITEEQVFKHDDLVRYTKEYGFEWPEDCSKLPQVTADWPGGRPEGIKDILSSCPAIEKVYLDKLFVDFGVSPKRAGQVRIILPTQSSAKVKSSVDISRGLLKVEYDLGRGKLIVDAFVHRMKNILVTKLTVEGQIPWLWLIVEKEPDQYDPTMPLPDVDRLDHFNGKISQTIPGKFDVDDFTWHLATAFPDRDQVRGAAPILELAYSFRQDLNLKDGDSVVMVLGIATDRDRCEDSEKCAIELAGKSSFERYDRELAEHIKSWEEFWSASSIQLDDKELESVWYRSMFGFACHLKPSAQAPGLVANIPLADYSPFHGDYTWNHNVQKWYVPALAVNHHEWYEVFADLLNQSIPTFEHLAKTIFGLEGVYCDLQSVPFVPPHRANVNNKWGRAPAMIGWLAYMLWQHWEFTHDKVWLQDRAYTFIKKTAQFYQGYLEKYGNETGDIFPSLRLEEPGWCKDFVGNTNVVTDLVMYRKAFKSAIKASEILNADSEDREKWKEFLQKIPEIEYGWTEDGQGWYALCKDWDKVDSIIDGRRLSSFADVNWRIQYARTARWGGGGWLVFPGEHIDGDEKGGLADAVRDMLRRTNIMNPPNTVCKIHAISSLIPFIRLGIKESFYNIRQLLLNHRYESGQFSSFSTGEGELQRGMQTWRIHENQFQGILGIAEMLLQSQGDVIRLFPFIPLNIGARFDHLRARGGFVVSAVSKAGKGLTEACIKSTAGGRCRIRWEEKELPVVFEGEKEVSFEKTDREIVFDTQAGMEYNIRR